MYNLFSYIFALSFWSKSIEKEAWHSLSHKQTDFYKRSNKKEDVGSSACNSAKEKLKNSSAQLNLESK